MTIDPEVSARLDRIERKIDKIAEPVVRLATRGESRKEQAKRLGVHASTLRRREAKERMRQMLENRV